MVVLLVVLGLGSASAAATVAVLSRRGSTAAVGPRVDPSRIARIVLEHPTLSRWLRRAPGPVPTTVVTLVAASTVLVLIAAVSGVSAFLVNSELVTGRTDGPLARWAEGNVTTEAAQWIRAITALGDAITVIVAGVLLALVELRRRNRTSVLLLVLTVGGQFLIVNSIKVLVDRARPDLLQLGGHAGASFPSGHAAAAAASFACFAFLLGRDATRPGRLALTSLAVGIAVAVAASRVALGVHWFTDVVAGLLVGWGWFAVCTLAVGGPSLRFGEPVAVAERAAEPRARR